MSAYSHRPPPVFLRSFSIYSKDWDSRELWPEALWLCSLGRPSEPPPPDPSDCVVSLGNLAVRHSALWIASQLGPDISDTTATEQFIQQSPVAGPATSRQHLAKMRMSGTPSIRAVGRALLPAQEETRGSATANSIARLPSSPAHCQALQGLHFVPGQDVPLIPLPPQVTGWVHPYPPIHPSAWDHQ